jgi:hypothetical protein
MIVMRPAAIAGPDAQRHGRGNADVAGLDFRLPMLIAKTLEIDLPSGWKTSVRRCMRARALELSPGQLFNCAAIRQGEGHAKVDHSSLLTAIVRRCIRS